MKKMWKRLISLVLLLAICLSQGLAFADRTGELTIKIGKETSTFDRKGIKVDLYRVSTNVIEEDWSMLPAFSGIDLPSVKDETRQAEKTDAANEAIRKVIKAANVKPTATGETDKDGQFTVTGLEPGVYYGRVTERPEYLKVKDFLVSVPKMQENGEWSYSAEATLKYSYEPPAPSPSPSPEPTEAPSPTPTVFETATPAPTATPEAKVDPTPTPTPTPVPSATPRPTDTPAPEPHKLIIHYLYADTGETAFPDYNDTLWEGESYDVVSPILPNYWYDIPEVIGVMPNHDMEYTVLYYTRKTGWRYRNIDDYETALGIGMIQMHVGVCYE